MPEAPKCPHCGSPLPREGWEGLCPKCVVRILQESPAAQGAAKASESGSPEPQQPQQPHLPQSGSEQAGVGPEKIAASSGPDILPVQIGTTIGRYKLLQQIGEGGFGVVFMAEQTEPVQRKVALKVIKAGMDTREVILRFEAERQALALMDHPNIAKIHDAGSTEHPIAPSLSSAGGDGARRAGEGIATLTAGRPYFVMELVRGLPITEYCEQCNSSTRERLELLIKVCHAVQHAHQKGVIHRDLKPSNVLVTLHDGVAVPKIIDFGVAKALGQKLTDKPLFTRFEQMIGTPAYMSPEQAALSGQDIDTRSDIYSLGVMLYELLTGVTPFVPDTLGQFAQDEIRRVIQETQPPKPSTRLTDLVAADVRRLTASRHENDRASLRRLLQQKRELIGAVRGDLDWITMKALEKDRRRRYETVNGLALDLERHLNHEPVLARPPSALYRLERAARRHRGAFAAGAAVALTLVIGVVLSTWQAVRAFRAEELARQRVIDVAAERDKKEQARREAEAIATILTEVFQSPDPRRAGRAVTVAESLDRAVRRLDTDLAAQPARRAKLQTTLGVTYHALGLEREAIPLLEKARDYYLATVGRENSKTLSAINELANSYQAAGRQDEALQLREALLPLRRMVNGDEHPETLKAMAKLANSYHAAGRWDEAIKLREQVLGLYRKVFGPKNGETVLPMHNLANSYYAAGRQDEALKLREEVLALRRNGDHPEGLGIVDAMNNLAISYYSAGRLEEALRLREEVLAQRRELLGPEHPNTLQAMNHLANSYYAAGRRDEALKLREEVLALRRNLLGPEHPDTLDSLRQLAEFHKVEQRYAEAELLYREMLQSQSSRYPSTNDSVVSASCALAGFLHDWAWSERGAADKTGAIERAREAERLLHDCLATRTMTLRPGCWSLADTRTQLGGALVAHAVIDSTMAAESRRAKLAEAETLLLSAYEGTKRPANRLPSDQTPTILEFLVRLYEANRDATTAADWKKKLDDINHAAGTVKDATAAAKAE